MDKLPADLPENWTQGQTISPNGTEVGLTEQHGYNYLNKQVNAAQRAINDIHTELDGAAKETTLTEIDAKIGEPEDSSTQSTIFGRLAEIKQIILEKASEIISAVTEFVDKIGNPGDSNSTNTVFGRLANVQDIVTKVGKYGDSTSASTLFGQIAKVYNKVPTTIPVVRNVKTYYVSESRASSPFNVPISGFTNTSKMVCISQCSTGASNYSPWFINSISTSSIQLKLAYTDYSNGQLVGYITVVEFY